MDNKKYSSCIIILSAFSLFLFGCSATYRIGDFSSKDKFYEDFNKSASSKSLNIILNNDNTFSAGSGAMILNDSLFFLVQSQRDEKIKRDKIKDIQYTGSDMSNLYAIIELKNGNKATAKNVNILSDSSINATVYYHIKKQISIDGIKSINYKNHWLGLTKGAIIGTVGGFATGFIVASSAQLTSDGPVVAGFVMTALGLIVGSIIGWNGGVIHTYEFTTVGRSMPGGIP